MLADFSKLQDGFGSATPEELDELNKALQAGSGYTGAPSALAGGGALQVESLEATLKSVTYGNKHFVTWARTPKDPAHNTVEEYNRVISYGEQQNGLFFDADAGTTPTAQDSNYVRQIQIVRYMGTTRVISHPLTLIRPAHGPIVAREIRNAVTEILGNWERQIWEANGIFQSATGTYVGAAGDISTGSLKFNGYDQQIRFGDTDANSRYTGFAGYGLSNLSSIVNAGDNPISEDILEESCRIAASNFGNLTNLFMTYKTNADFSKQFFPKERIMNMGVAQGRAGFVLNEFISSAGPIELAPTRFIDPKFEPLTGALTNSPATPVVGGTASEIDANSVLVSSAVGYSYRVSALNGQGESIACAATAAQVIAAGNRIAITINAGTVGAQYYAAYRAPVATLLNHRFIGFIADSTGNGGGATFRDAGYRLAGRQQAYLMSYDAENISWRQLAPLMKMDLAITGTAYRFMCMMYGTPVVFAPKKHCLIDNIGYL